jgi:serine/threonine-protein kinase
MELVEGQSLSDKLSDGPLTSTEALQCAAQVADALAHAHQRGVVHADLKSANIVMTPEGRAKVLDFGLAKRLAQEAVIDGTTQAVVTAPGTVPGTLAYMAPEQLRGGLANKASDVWSLGVVLYEIFVGARPFRGQTGFELSSAILNDAPVPFDRSVALGVRAVVERCLDKEPARRYQDGGEVLAALEMIRTGTVGQRVRLRARSAALRIAWAAALTLAIGTIVVLNVGGLRERLLGSSAPRISSLAVLPLEDLS